MEVAGASTCRHRAEPEHDGVRQAPAARLAGPLSIVVPLSYAGRARISPRQIHERSRAARMPRRRMKEARPVAERLSDIGIQRELGGLPGWSRRGDSLTKTYRFPTFPAAITFVTRVADVAESMDHHPDIDIRHTRLTFTLSTHDAGGITTNDLTLAREIERLARVRGLGTEPVNCGWELGARAGRWSSNAKPSGCRISRSTRRLEV